MLNEFLPHRFTDHIEKVTVNAQEIWVLDRQCLLKCKLSAYGNRAAEKDYEDIKTLIFGYPDEVQGYKHKLDQESVEFFINEGIVPLESQETVQLAKRILMLTEPSSLSSTS
ncbi:MAG: hypothetical protein FRX48_09744 [Lasallia pustulata]|uniref:Uncharacterized protein n=1 Tax=Lasallia pustulata TaxID=136370 RepID=A0A5M8PBN6_9LECA|nr:MAG: hypothetical protein FRX48_09744 [Lasallia pustulata]